MQISYLKHDEIDKSRWDNTIALSPNGNIYAQSWYLDAVCQQWEALVNNDYTAVMPLTKARKFGINYLYRPLLSQQLGVFSSQKLNNDDALSFFNSLPDKFKLVEIALNEDNPALVPGFSSSQHSNYVLNLKPDYNSISQQYSQNNQRNIRKALDKGIIFQEEPEPGAFLELLDQDLSEGSKVIREQKNIKLFNNLLDQMIKHNSALIYGAFDKSGKMITAVLFGSSNNKFYYLLPLNSVAGRENRALFGLIDAFIRKYCNEAMMLDFEGSDISGLARFYSGFGAQKTTYPFIRRNNLPWPLSIFKKA